MSYTNGGIFGPGGEGMPSPLVAAHSQYPSRFHGSTFFQPQSIPTYRENPLYVPGLGDSGVLCWGESTWQRMLVCVLVGAAAGGVVGAAGAAAAKPKPALKANLGTTEKVAIGGAVVGGIAGAIFCHFSGCSAPSADGVAVSPAAPSRPQFMPLGPAHMPISAPEPIIR